MILNNAKILNRTPRMTDSRILSEVGARSFVVRNYLEKQSKLRRLLIAMPSAILTATIIVLALTWMDLSVLAAIGIVLAIGICLLMPFWILRSWLDLRQAKTWLKDNNIAIEDLRSGQIG